MGILRNRRRRREAENDERERLEAVRRLAEEDTVVLGEQLQRLDADVAGQLVDEAGRSDYQAALDAYESAQRAVPRLVTLEDVAALNETLSAGRFALACVQARVVGDPLPTRRTMCFFNPQHGPSVADVQWTAPGRGTKVVPACAQDAARVAAGERPDQRRVRVGGQLLSVWDSAEYLPYGETYFATGTLTILGQRAEGGVGGMNTMGMG